MDEGHTQYLYPWRLITRDDADCAGVNDLPNKVRLLFIIYVIHKSLFYFAQNQLITYKKTVKEKHKIMKTINSSLQLNIYIANNIV